MLVEDRMLCIEFKFHVSYHTARSAWFPTAMAPCTFWLQHGICYVNHISQVSRDVKQRKSLSSFRLTFSFWPASLAGFSLHRDANFSSASEYLRPCDHVTGRTTCSGCSLEPRQLHKKNGSQGKYSLQECNSEV